ncbi:hypothetical protein [Agreia sp. COWG]|uniref:hypothetical protein n=1 Tax=Agreia sp. COWG TaxID=2773266 RepID=UPI0019277865|nr:hypothetical protein [Agreia sp. COWG]CAD6016221.1 protein of unknown function [Agreia sp. COWG]
MRFTVYGERNSGPELRDSYTKWVLFDVAPRAGDTFIPGNFGPDVDGTVAVHYVEHAPFPEDPADPTAYVVIDYLVPESDPRQKARRDWFVLNDWHVFLRSDA